MPVQATPLIDLRTGEVAFELIESDGFAGIEQAAALASLGRAVRLRLPRDVLVAPQFLERVLGAVRDNAAEPALIAFEIPLATGDEAVRVGRVTRALAACRFGCEPEGRSLTIKPTIVHDARGIAMSRSLVRGMVTVARVLGHKTIAEGAHDEHTRALLRTLGVDYAVAS